VNAGKSERPSEGIAGSPLGNYVRRHEEAWDEAGTSGFKSFRIVD